VLLAEVKLLYVSPEKALTEEFFSLLRRVKITFFAIDEAHCISAWGHDFRPEYTRLSLLRERFPEVPMIALTATADRVTRQDILTQLRLRDARTFVSSFDRPNLSLNVLPGQKRFEQVLEFIHLRPEQPGIIYCLSRKSTEELTFKLQAKGIAAAFYHAGMTDVARSRVQEDFIFDRVPVICATVAFGMGIDKSNVRWVIHYHLPQSIESYYQEIGRAGRDGRKSDTMLLFSYADVIQRRKFIAESGQPELQEAKLQRMIEYADAQICRRRILLAYFGEHLDQNCGNCDVCRRPPRRFDGTILAQKALSALMRMQENVGMGMLIDVLRGSTRRELIEKGFDKIKTYGAGADMPLAEWQHVLTQLLNLGLLEIAYEQNYTLRITQAGRAVLFDGAKVELSRREEIAPLRKEEPRTTTGPYDEKLFETLRRLRLRLAREAGIPPYQVFTDATLEEMSRRFPESEAAMRGISGVGERKMKNYGEEFIAAIRQFRRQKP
jgi:ATP-dependent DNA helicase RecQ